MLKAALTKYVDPANEQKVLFKRPLSLRIFGGVGFSFFFPLTVFGLVEMVSGMIYQHQNDWRAYFLVLIICPIPFLFLIFGCLYLMGAEDTAFDFSSRTYTVKRGFFMFPRTMQGSFDDIQRISILNTSDAKTNLGIQVRLVRKLKRRDSILGYISDYPTASELGWQLADQLGMAFRENQPFGNSR